MNTFKNRKYDLRNIEFFCTALRSKEHEHFWKLVQHIICKFSRYCIFTFFANIFNLLKKIIVYMKINIYKVFSFRLATKKQTKKPPNIRRGCSEDTNKFTIPFLTTPSLSCSFMRCSPHSSASRPVRRRQRQHF